MYTLAFLDMALFLALPQSLSHAPQCRFDQVLTEQYTVETLSEYIASAMILSVRATIMRDDPSTGSAITLTTLMKFKAPCDVMQIVARAYEIARAEKVATPQASALVLCCVCTFVWSFVRFRRWLLVPTLQYHGACSHHALLQPIHFVLDSAVPSLPHST